MLIAEYDLDIQVQREECYNSGMLVGIQKGEARGKTMGFLNTATRMKKANCDIAFISEITGLSIEEIAKLSTTSHILDNLDIVNYYTGISYLTIKECCMDKFLCNKSNNRGGGKTP